MKYILLIYANEAGLESASKKDIEQMHAAYGAYTEALQKAGVIAGGDRLRPTTTATTVRVANGKTNVDPEYNQPLIALAEKAKTVNGYMVEVKGYASATGSAALNQRLSEDRANSVTSILLQQGHIPLTNMLAPGAMGESSQIGGSDKTAAVEAENRRVVVRILQNKAIAGT